MMQGLYSVSKSFKSLICTLFFDTITIRARRVFLLLNGHVLSYVGDTLCNQDMCENFEIFGNIFNTNSVMPRIRKTILV